MSGGQEIGLNESTTYSLTLVLKEISLEYSVILSRKIVSLKNIQGMPGL